MNKDLIKATEKVRLTIQLVTEEKASIQQELTR